MPSLPPINAVPDLPELADNGLGVAALDGNKNIISVVIINEPSYN